MKKLEDKPFALLGINSDRKAQVLKAIKRESINWRSWWDGGNAQGPIPTQWNVKSWSTLYILDHNGIIRHKNLRSGAMESAVDALLEEMEQ